MPTANTSLIKWLTLLVMLALLIVVVLDVDGWGTFLLSVAFTLFVQVTMALILFGCLMVMVDIVKGALNITSLSQYIQLGIFLASVIAVLPLIGIVFHRPIDIYDIAQTVLVIVGGLLFVPLKDFFIRPAVDQTPQPPV